MMHGPSKRKSAALLFTRHELALIAVTVMWGGTFLIIHIAMRSCGPLFFVGLRFLVGGMACLALFGRLMAGLTRRELWAGVVIGLSIFLGYTLQTAGLKTISSSQSAFLTALYVPIVPVLQWAALRRPPHVMSWLGIAMAFVGLVLLSGAGGGHVSLSRGEVITLLGAVATAVQIILIGHFADGVDSRRITVVQLLTASIVSFATMPVASESWPVFSWVWLACAGGLGLATGIIQLTMNWAQKEVSPTRATVIYAGEPVWAGIVGRLAGDFLPAASVLGAGFIVAGVIVSEWRPKRWLPPQAG